MNAILPCQYTADAVPDKRTADEEQMPPAAVQADEMLRRVEEQAKLDKEQEDKKDKKQRSSGEGCSSSESSEPPKSQKTKSEPKRTKSSSDKKHTGAARRGTPTEVNVVNISQSSGFHVGHKIEIHNNFVNGASSSRAKPQDPPPDQPATSPHSEQPRKLLKSLKTVTKEDCIHVSEHSSCKWEELGELLFFEETSRLEQYRTEIGRHPRKKAVQLILEEWRKFAGNNALVARLSRELLKLNEIEALKKLAKRHNID